MSDIFSESSQLKQALTPMIQKIVEEQTRECLRTYKAKVVEPPDLTTGKCGIKLVGEEKTLYLPFSMSVTNVLKGDMVWVATTYNSWKNAVVWQTIGFDGTTGGDGNIIAVEFEENN